MRAVQYSTVQYSTVQYSTVQYSTVQFAATSYLTHTSLSVWCRLKEGSLNECTKSVYSIQQIKHAPVSMKNSRLVLLDCQPEVADFFFFFLVVLKTDIDPILHTAHCVLQGPPQHSILPGLQLFVPLTLVCDISSNSQNYERQPKLLFRQQNK
jgi:hypothetical protein